jgi:hypothetical protein
MAIASYGIPKLPTYGTPTGPPSGGATQDRSNIDQLLSGQFDPYEINMQSAEKAVGSGTGGSGFAQAGRYKLLDSEKLARQQLGHQELEPYLNREHQSAMQSEGEAARLKEISAQGEQAMQQLAAAQSGRMAELSQQEKAQLEYLAQQGNQATEQLKLQQAGNREITGMNIAGNIVTSSLRGGSGGGGLAPRFNQKYGGQSYNYTTDTDGNVTSGKKEPADYWNAGASPGGDRNVNILINDILRKYNFNNLKF